jgi:hypothetical protein
MPHVMTSLAKQLREGKNENDSYGSGGSNKVRCMHQEPVAIFFHGAAFLLTPPPACSSPPPSLSWLPSSPSTTASPYDTYLGSLQGRLCGSQGNRHQLRLDVEEPWLVAQDDASCGNGEDLAIEELVACRWGEE